MSAGTAHNQEQFASSLAQATGDRRPKSANYSDLMKKRVELGPRGVKVNVCPFGCETDRLDDLGFCDHLVGFTNENLGMGRFELMLPPAEGDRHKRRRVDGRIVLPVLKDDVLVRVTSDHRVYRRGGVQAALESVKKKTESPEGAKR